MLQEYKRKRDFKITPEPAGAEKVEPGKRDKGKSLTFVIQKHRASHLHYDFRLEIDGVMVSWAVPKGPSLNPAVKRLAMMTEDHPIEYSSFEGIIPDKQYGAGEVIIWDQGVYSPDEGRQYSWNKKTDANKRMREGVEKGKLSFYLKGARLEGSWTLVRLHNKVKEWLLIKHHDQFEDTKNDITEQDSSVVSGLTIEDLQQNGADRIWTRGGAKVADPETTGRSSKKVATKAGTTKVSKAPAKEKIGAGTGSGSEKGSLVSKVAADDIKTEAQLLSMLERGKKAAFPKEITPMLATLADAPFELDGWFFEPKLDGVRAIAYVKNGDCRLSSRTLNDLTVKYPAIAEKLSVYNENYVFDGEVVALDEAGKPSFQLLQQGGRSLKTFNSNKADASLVYYVFDILHAQGKDLTQLPVVDRKKDSEIGFED